MSSSLQRKLATVLANLLLVCAIACRPATAQFSAQNAYDILTKSDHVGFCAPQAGAYFPLYFNVGCCGSPGFRTCPYVIHFGKGSWGLSAGCSDPEVNQVNGDTCELPAFPPPIPHNYLPPEIPGSGRNINFMVTSDLHFYRQDYNVMDQVTHPSIMLNWGLSQALIPPDFPIYQAVFIAGDMSTGSIDDGYHNQDDRISAYRMMWENNWPSLAGYLPGASAQMAVYPTLGNHEGVTTGKQSATIWWNYMSALLQNQNVDRNGTGCLIGIDSGCFDEGNQGGSLNYSFDWEGVHILMLNTWAGDNSNPYRPLFGSNGRLWLQKDLAHYVGNTGKPVIIVQHYGLDGFSLQTAPNTIWWTQNDVAAFIDSIKQYNVIGLFTGHSHGLGSPSATNSVNANSGNAVDPLSFGLGETLDNFIDGSGGDCHSSAGIIKDDPAASEFCAHATKSFLSVHVDGKYLEVKTLSYSDIVPMHLDGAMGLIGQKTGDSATCKKRIGGFYRIPSGVDISLSYALNGFDIQNNSGKVIKGPLALWVQDEPNEPTSWDFVDSCSSAHPHKFFVVTEGDLAAGATITIRVPTSSGFTYTAGVSLVQLADSLTMSPATPVVGSAAPATITVSSDQGSVIPFSVAIDGPPFVYDAKWLHVSPSPANGRIFTTPQTFTVTADSLPSYPQLFQNLTITNRSANASSSLNSTVLLGNSRLNIETNVQGAQATIAGRTLPLPTSDTVGAPGALIPLATTSPQYPSPGTRLTFQEWEDSGALAHTYSLPPGGVNKTIGVKFTTAYQLTPTIIGDGTLSLKPNNADGYYESNSSLSIQATPNAGSYFAGFGGGIAGNSNRAEGKMVAPLAFTAKFLKNPSISVISNITAGEGAYVTADGTQSPIPFSTPVAPDAIFPVTLPANFISKTNPGVRYVFRNWADGDTNLTKSITGGTADQAFLAIYQKQVQISVTAVPAAGGTVTGAGWYDLAARIPLAASASGGYRFTGFTGDITSTSPMQSETAATPLRVTATFAPASPAIAITASKIDDSDPAKAALTLLLSNNGLGTVDGLTISSITALTLSGTGDATIGLLPASPLSLAGGQSSQVPLSIAWPLSVSRVRLTVNLSGNNGTYKTSQILNLFR